MQTPIYQAEQYFQDLWHRGKQKLLLGDVAAAQMKDGVTVPVDYCLSTIARIQEQIDNPLASIEAVKDRFRTVSRDLFFYPPQSTHITLLGCTQRVSSKAAFTDERIERVAKVCSRVLVGTGTVRMILRGVNIVGNQVFVQVFPHTHQWTELRQRLEEAIRAIGEQPVSYANKAPIHLNIVRLTDNMPSTLSRILDTVDSLRDFEVGDLEVSRVDFMLTDFVVSPVNAKRVGRFVLSDSVSTRRF